MKRMNKCTPLCVFLCFLMVLTLSVNAQKKTSVFQKLTWEQAAAQAQKEGKIVLVDAMRKAMKPEMQKKQEEAERDLMKAPGVREFCDRNVVAIHIDMMTEEGSAFAPKLVMNMYPTYGFFMPNGDILGVVSPYLLTKDPGMLIKTGEKAVKAAAVKRGNSRVIAFEEISLKDAMVKAKKENKLIFIDAYTDYCQPCVLMVKNVFSLDRVADFYNQHFINLKMHFGKEKELADKYGTHGYPSFVFINGDGKLVYLAGGYTEGDKFIGYGQEALKKAEGITFTAGSWEQALEKAKQENKLIFMDCYTSWCGPCKKMAKTVFTDPEVAAFFNEKFVNVKVDMEKGEGKELKDRYAVSAYPTLNFIGADGKMVHCVVGGMDAGDFVKQAEIALSGKGLASMMAIYQGGNRTPEFIQEYLNVLDVANRAKEAEQVTLDYFATLDKGKLKEKGNWDLFMKYINDVNSEVFTYVYDHRMEFCQFFGDKEVKQKIATVWAIGGNQFVSGRGEEAVLDEKGFKRYVKRLKKADVDGKEGIIMNARMSNAEKIGDWKTYIALGSEELKKGQVADLVLYNWGLRISQQCKDQALRLQAAQWFDDAVAVCVKQEEAGGKQSMMSYRTFFEKLASELKK
ncbi:MAG: thioredoxin family protein [Odoribacter sp.]